MRSGSVRHHVDRADRAFVSRLTQGVEGWGRRSLDIGHGDGFGIRSSSRRFRCGLVSRSAATGDKAQREHKEQQ